MTKSKKIKKSFRGKVKRTVEKRESAKSGFSYLKLPQGVSLYKPHPGASEKINIVPYLVGVDNHPDHDKKEGMALKGEPWFQLPFKVHSNIGAGDTSKTVVCPTTFGKKCPICDYATLRAKQGADWEELKEYRPKDRILYAVQEVSTKSKNDTDFSVMDMSYHLFQKALDEEIAENEENESYADLEGGATLKIRWKAEKYGKHTFAECGRIDFLEREDLDEDILENVPCLDTLLKIQSYEDLEKLFLQGTDVDEDDDDEEEEEKPAPKKKTTRKKAAPKEEEEEEEEEEDKPFDTEEEEEEEEEEKPVRKKKSTKTEKPAPKKKPVVEEDEEEEEEEEEEEKPAPKKKPAAKKKAAPKEEVEEEEEEDIDISWEDIADADISDLIDIAEGLGFNIEDEDEEELKDLICEKLGLEKPAPKKKPATKKKAAPKETDSGDCPDGGTFGVDFETLEGCANCPNWDACADRNDEL